MNATAVGGPVHDARLILFFAGVIAVFYVLKKLWPVKRPPDE